MANSYEIAQMFSQQNSMFMGQNQFAQQLGVPAPPSIMSQVGVGGGGGVGAVGMGRGGMGGGGFNWGQSGMMGYGPGNSMASGMMSGAGAAFTGGSMALGAASMFGMMGKAGALFDPIGAGMGAARMVGGGLMGGIAGTGVGAALIGGGMLASQAVQSFVGGGQQQSQMNTMLGSQYQHFNPLSRTGSGFTRDDAKSIGDMTRQLSHLPEMMSEYGELQKIMGKLKSSGTMQGVRSAADFQARFKEAITTIRETAKILGTTMEEAEQFFSASRGAGFYGKSAQLKNVMSAQFTSGVTGASIGQVAGLQQAGADMAMASGARRGLGATAVTNMAQSIGLAQASGRLREGAVEDVTGLQGSEGQLALAQKMYGGMMNFGKTAAGRLAMAGMMKFEGDRAVGVDEEKVKAFQRGELSVDDLKRTASGLTNKQKISYTTRQADLVSSLAGQMGAGGASAMMRQVLGQKGDDETTNLIMQRLTGMSAGEADIAKGMEGMSGDSEAAQMARFRQAQASRKESTDPSAIIKKAKTRLHAKTFGKLEQLGADVQNSIAKSIDTFFDDVVGREVSTLTEDRAKAVAAAFSGSTSKDAQEMLRGLTNIDTKGLTTGGGLQKKGINSMGLASRIGLGIATMGQSEAIGQGIESIRGLGGGEGPLMRAMGWATGEMTKGQAAEFGSKVLGTSDALGQLKAGERLKSKDLAGKGATEALLGIQASEEYGAKSGADKLKYVSEKLQEKVEEAAKRAGFSSLKTLDLASADSIDGMAKSDADKKLLKSYLAAHDDRSRGKGDVFSQMAAASGMGGDFAALAGQGGLSAQSAAAQELLRKADQGEGGKGGLVGQLGETAAGYVKSGERAKKLFKAAISNPDTMQAIISGDKAVAKGLGVSEKEFAALQEAVKGYAKNDKMDPAAANKAMTDYDNAAATVAGVETRKIAKTYGANLVGTASDAGGASDAQKALGEALVDVSEGGTKAEVEAKMGKFQGAFDKYKEAINAISDPKKREEAVAAGGVFGSRVASATAKEKKYKDKVFKSKKEAAEALGVSEEDIDKTGGFHGKLEAGQLKKLTSMGAIGSAVQGILSNDKQPGGTGDPKDAAVIDAMKKISDNQILLASKLGVDITKPEGGPSTAENANADSKGKTTWGKIKSAVGMN